MTEFVVDIETTMDPVDTVRLIGVHDMDMDLGMSYHGSYNFKVWLDSLTEDDTIFTWNGSRFDWPVLEELTGVMLNDCKAKHVDGYIVSKLLMPDLSSHSLAALGKHFYPTDPDYHKVEPWFVGGMSADEIFKAKKQFYNHAPLKDLESYMYQDLRVTAGVIEMLKLIMRKVGGKWAHPIQVEQKIAEITERQVKKKVKFDRDHAEITLWKIQMRMEEIERNLEPHLPIVPIHKPHIPPKVQFLKDGSPSKLITSYCEKYGWELKLHAGHWTAQKDGPTGMGKLICCLPLTEALDSKEKLTLAQQPRIKDWLIEQGWRPTMFNTKKDKDGKWVKTTARLTDKITKEPCPSLSKIGIHWVPEFSEWLMLRSRANLLRSSKGTGWLVVSEEDGCIASDADTVGANTGRYKHRGIVNVPRVTSPYGKDFRQMFMAREGKVWVGWDASSLEACMEAHYVYPFDPAYAETLVSGSSDLGTDVHSRNMDAMGLPNRDVAKTFKYAVTYGAQPPKIAESLNISKSQATLWFYEFWDNNPGLLEFKTRLEREWNDHDKRFIIGLDGRLISTRSKHSLVNAKFQSAGAIVMKHACLLADKRIKDWIHGTYWDAYGLIRYHDEEVWECDPEVSADVLKIGIKSIKDAGRFLKLNVPITGAGKIGKTWADVH